MSESKPEPTSHAELWECLRYALGEERFGQALDRFEEQKEAADALLLRAQDSLTEVLGIARAVSHDGAYVAFTRADDLLTAIALFDITRAAERRLASQNRTVSSTDLNPATEPSCTCRNFGPHEYREIDPNCAVHAPAKRPS